jgi:hypothetical protein
MILKSESDEKIRSLLAHVCQLSELFMPIVGRSQSSLLRKNANIIGGIAQTVECSSIKCKTLS